MENMINLITNTNFSFNTNPYFDNQDIKTIEYQNSDFSDIIFRIDQLKKENSYFRYCIETNNKDLNFVNENFSPSDDSNSTYSYYDNNDLEDEIILCNLLNNNDYEGFLNLNNKPSDSFKFSQKHNEQYELEFSMMKNESKIEEQKQVVYYPNILDDIDKSYRMEEKRNIEIIFSENNDDFKMKRPKRNKDLIHTHFNLDKDKKMDNENKNDHKSIFDSNKNNNKNHNNFDRNFNKNNDNSNNKNNNNSNDKSMDNIKF